VVTNRARQGRARRPGQTPAHWTCWRPAATAYWFVAPFGLIRWLCERRIRVAPGIWTRGQKKQRSISHTHTYACTRDFLIQYYLFARARGPTHKSSRAGGFLAAIRIWEFRSPPPPPRCTWNKHKQKKSKNYKTIKKEWKQMKQGKGNTVKKI
jgi:hypothetical protein